MNKATWFDKYPDCRDLSTLPAKTMGRILVTGASGYIGGRLVPELITRGYHVRVMVRASSPEYKDIWPKAEIVVADALDFKSLTKAMDGIDTSYYLIHSLLLGQKKFGSIDLQAAVNFRKAAEENKIKRIIANPLENNLVAFKMERGNRSVVQWIR